jgi:Fic family protein
MVSIVTKKIKSIEYIYLVDSLRKNGKVIQKTIKYIGRKRPVLMEEFECMKLSYKRKDWILNKFEDELSYKDHAQMKQCSDGYKKYIDGLDSVSKEKLREKFLSVFIANSNAIEGSSLTIKDTTNYLFRDIVPKGYRKKELFMASNLLKAWNYVEENKIRLPNHKDLLKLHELVNKDIEDDETLGKLKEVQNYIGDVYTTSYLFVEERMDALLSWIKKAFAEVDDFEVAFQSHAQFEIIHPFVDGNGRVGRLLLNWLLMYKGLMPLAIPVNKREDYITALNNSRKGIVETICVFCFKEYTYQYKQM